MTRNKLNGSEGGGEANNLQVIPIYVKQSVHSVLQKDTYEQTARMHRMQMQLYLHTREYVLCASDIRNCITYTQSLLVGV